MNKSDIINAYHLNHPEETKAQLALILEEFLDIIKTCIIKSGKVTLANFGAFKSKTTESKQARNPRTGGTIASRPRRKVLFKPAASLKVLD